MYNFSWNRATLNKCHKQKWAFCRTENSFPKCEMNESAQGDCTLTRVSTTNMQWYLMWHNKNKLHTLHCKDIFDTHKYEQARNVSHQLCSSESIGPECWCQCLNTIGPQTYFHSWPGHTTVETIGTIQPTTTLAPGRLQHAKSVVLPGYATSCHQANEAGF